MRSAFRTFLQGLVVTVPVVLTVYVCAKVILWLDTEIRAGLEYAHLPDVPGLGVVVAFAGIYLIGLLAKTWLFRQFVRLGEAVVERIPLVKSLYSAVKDLLQFLSGTDAEARGVPARLKLLDGRVHMMGLITQKEPETFLGEAERDRVAVYLPMSYQIGGFTVYVSPEQVEEIEDLTVEDVLKLALTAGVGKTKDKQHKQQQEPGEPRASDPGMPGPA